MGKLIRKISIGKNETSNKLKWNEMKWNDKIM